MSLAAKKKIIHPETPNEPVITKQRIGVVVRKKFLPGTEPDPVAVKDPSVEIKEPSVAVKEPSVEIKEPVAVKEPVAMKEPVAVKEQYCSQLDLNLALEGVIKLLNKNTETLMLYIDAKIQQQTEILMKQQPVNVPEPEPVNVPTPVNEPEAEPVNMPETVNEPEAEPVNMPETVNEPEAEQFNIPEPVNEPEAEPVNMPEPVNEHEAEPVNIQAPMNEPEPIKEPEPINIVTTFNNFFDATFILDITGNATALATKLHLFGVKNCVIVSPDLPDNCQSKDRIVYFIHSAIDTAQSEGWNTVNIIANHIKPHINLFEILNTSMNLIKTTDWDILHYCSNNHTYEPQQMELEKFKWQEYVLLNPDISEPIKLSEVRATQDWCTRGCKTGRSAITKLVETTTNNTLAFCIKSTCFSEILKNLDDAISSPQELPLLNITGKKLLFTPNLFIVPGTGASIMKQLRWIPQLYLET